ncbi:hypothetical protein I7I51_00393 [Histoplasma capsulatum]|uniref:Uncharacterized protein n=1 Tax=Ajellomyces capsulatus TaxID=5037 RepID=A0A8A1M9Z7_AJECA|nr:hypothetical protein I7I51_00393 [Histoplasma capsulatum]
MPRTFQVFQSEPIVNLPNHSLSSESHFNLAEISVFQFSGPQDTRNRTTASRIYYGECQQPERIHVHGSSVGCRVALISRRYKSVDVTVNNPSGCSEYFSKTIKIMLGVNDALLSLF